jgi:Ca2+-transporting ATPase
MLNWYTQKIPHLLHEFKTDLERGLSSEEATAQGSKYGNNPILQSHESSLLILLLKQCTNLTVLLLFVIICSLFYFQRSIHEILVFSAILCFHVLWRFIQAGRTHYQLRSIRTHLEVSVSVIRDERVLKLSPMAIVPGDLLLLKGGDYIPADARIVEADALVVDEAPVFGTTTYTQKTDEEISTPDLPPEKQSNMIFAGTYVLEGEARAIVVGTGDQLEINKSDQRTPAIVDLDAEAEVQMGFFYDYFRIAGGILGGAALIAAWLLQDKSTHWNELLFLGFGFVIASIPEGIVSTSRAILAQHAYRLLEKGVAIRNLVNLERLSRLTAVCVDEAGNFMKEEMTASHVFVGESLVDQKGWEAWLKSRDEHTSDEIDEETIATTLPDSEVPSEFPLLILLASRCAGDNGRSSLDETSTAVEASIGATLNRIAERIGFDLERYNAAFTKIDEQAQTSEHPYTTLVFALQDGKFLKLIFGDAEAVLQMCHRIQLDGTTNYMNFDQKQLTHQAIEYLSNSRTRALAVAYRNLNTPPSPEETQHNMTFLGFITFTDLEYPNSKEVIQSCLDAGLKIITITDRDRNAALDVAKHLAIVQDKHGVVTQEDLAEFSDEHYESMVNRLLVYCRPSPAQKQNLVQHLKRLGHSVGFWGKSPLDLRAMRMADVSFASAARSSHIVQHRAACVVLKDGFDVIAELIHQVRESYMNLRSSMRWLLSCSLAQLITLFIGSVLPYISFFPLLRDLPMPLSLLQLCWAHLLVNLIPLMGLGHDRIRGDLRYSKPQNIPPFLSRADFYDVLLRSLVIASMTIFNFILTFVSLAATQQNPQVEAQTAACTTLILGLLISNFQCHRLFWESVFQRIKANLPLCFTILACIVLHLSIVYLPTTQRIFGFAPLFKEWQWILPFCAVLLFFPLNLTIRRR